MKRTEQFYTISRGTDRRKRKKTGWGGLKQTYAQGEPHICGTSEARPFKTNSRSATNQPGRCKIIFLIAS